MHSASDNWSMPVKYSEEHLLPLIPPIIIGDGMGMGMEPNGLFGSL